MNTVKAIWNNDLDGCWCYCRPPIWKLNLPTGFIAFNEMIKTHSCLEMVFNCLEMIFSCSGNYQTLWDEQTHRCQCGLPWNLQQWWSHCLSPPPPLPNWSFRPCSGQNWKSSPWQANPPVGCRVRCRLQWELKESISFSSSGLDKNLVMTQFLTMHSNDHSIGIPHICHFFTTTQI